MIEFENRRWQIAQVYVFAFIKVFIELVTFKRFPQTNTHYMVIQASHRVLKFDCARQDIEDLRDGRHCFKVASSPRLAGSPDCFEHIVASKRKAYTKQVCVREHVLNVLRNILHNLYI
jgi:hypothetical protein